MVRETSSNSGRCLTDPLWITLSKLVCKDETYSVNKWRQAKLSCFVFLAVIRLQSGQAIQQTFIYKVVEAEVADREKHYTMHPEGMFYVFVGDMQLGRDIQAHLQSCRVDECYQATGASRVTSVLSSLIHISGILVLVCEEDGIARLVRSIR